MWVDFNINHSVRVQLTPVGIQAMKKRHDELWRNAGDKAPRFKLPEVDREGWTKFQMWELMREVGHACGNGFDVPIYTAIQLEVQTPASEGV